MQQIDLFGSQMLFRFKGQQTHNTKFGSLCTLAIAGVIGLRLFFIIKDVFLRNSPQVIYQERQVDSPQVFEINKDSYQMAFGMQDQDFNHYIDDSIYTMKVTQRSKVKIYNKDTGIGEDVWKDREIKIARCSLDIFQGTMTEQYFKKMKLNDLFCFPIDEKLYIEGDFSSSSFFFLRLTVSKCTQSCKSATVLDEYLKSANFAAYFSDVYIDPTEKSNPFRRYPRDYFWTTSTQVPKDVEFLMRNNYVESDFGWVQEDKQTSHFPQFSRAEVNIKPSDFQRYFLQIILRFEKQKENYYQRNYKNLNSIISEIGGFTQSLLAIGFLICSRLSQLDLNKEIINEAFNFENIQIKEKEQTELLNVKSNMQSHETVKQKLNKQFQETKQNIQIPLPPSPLDNNFHSLQIPSHFNNYPPPLLQNNFNNSPEAIMNIANPKKKSFLMKSQQDEEHGLSQNILNQYPDENEKQFLSFLIKNPNTNQFQSNLSHQIQENVQTISPDHERLRQQQQKLNEKEQKLKESMFKKLMQKATSSMSLSLLEYLKFFLWPFGAIKQKKQIIDYSIDKLYYHLDVLQVVKKLMEIDKLKRILLDSDQLRLFEYIPKPTIQSNFGQDSNTKSFIEIDTHYQDSRTELQKAQEAYVAYQNITLKPTISDLNYKILDLLDPKLLDLFGINQITKTASFRLTPSQIDYSTTTNLNKCLKKVYQKDNILPLPHNEEEHPNQSTSINPNQLQNNIVVDNILHSPHFDSQLSMFSEIASDEADKKQEQIHQFKRVKPPNN